MQILQLPIRVSLTSRGPPTLSAMYNVLRTVLAGVLPSKIGSAIRESDRGRCRVFVRVNLSHLEQTQLGFAALSPGLPTICTFRAHGGHWLLYGFHFRTPPDPMPFKHAPRRPVRESVRVRAGDYNNTLTSRGRNSEAAKPIRHYSDMV